MSAQSLDAHFLSDPATTISDDPMSLRIVLSQPLKDFHTASPKLIER